MFKKKKHSITVPEIPGYSSDDTHDHEWFVFNTKTEFKEQPGSTNYLRVEYAYAICKSCPNPKIRKVLVEND